MVYKRILIVYFIMLICGCSHNVSSESQPIVLERQSVSVAIKPVAGTCSEVELSYFVNVFEGQIFVPKSVVGAEGHKFSLAVLSLNGNERLPMIVNGKANNDEIFKWDMDGSPYVFKVNLNEYFNLKKGKYYVEYLYSYAPYKAGLENNNESWIYELIKSNRYYIEFNESNCISYFLE